MDEKFSSATALGIITALFGVIVYLIRKPQDLQDKRIEELALAIDEIKRDLENFKRVVWKEFSNMKDLIITILRSGK